MVAIRARAMTHKTSSGEVAFLLLHGLRDPGGLFGRARAMASTHPKFKDLSGLKFGRWTVLEHVKISRRPAHWLCVCECGTKRVLNGHNLRSGITKSCGCAPRKKRTHGKCKTPEYRVWASMIGRCSYEGDTNFKKYGARGIRVCARWRHDFAAFLSDMGLRPTPKHSIDRIDTNGDYEPGNCRWATMKEQARNTRSNRLITFRGETRCLIEWSEILGMYRKKISRRLDAGIPMADIVRESGVAITQEEVDAWDKEAG